ncbi:MAG: cytochrome c [Pseudomonadales bacterium]|nr:cytochrome c [Pseudomonadales bacterium]
MRLTRSAKALAVFLLSGAAAQADQGAIDYRQSVYSSIGGHMGGISGILKREVPHTGDLGVHARGIAELAPLTLHLFPEGSDDGRTKARAAIWEDPDTFSERRQDFIDAAADLGAADPADMEAFVAAFRSLGGTCKACHDDFKAD